MPDDEATKFIATQVGDATPEVFALFRVLPWVGLWVVSIIAIMTLARLGYVLEDLQTLFFPLVLFLFWRVSRCAGVALPRGLLLIAVSFWIAGALHVRGYYPADFFPSGVYLGRLADDADGTAARALYHRYNQIAAHYGLTPMSLIHRSFGDDGEMSKWIIERPQINLLIGGDAEWLRVSLPPGEHFPDNRVPGAGSENSLLLARNNYQIPPSIGLKSLRITNAERDFLLVMNPPSIRVPGAPTELTRHYLAWLAKGLSSDAQLLDSGMPKGLEPLRTAASDEELRREVRLFHFGNSSFVDGPWKSYAPRGLSIFYEANLALLEALNGNTNPSSLGFIAELYAKASGRVRERYEPELHSAIFNNAAVAYLLLGTEEEHFKKAVRLLGDSLNSRSRAGELASAAPISLINLRTAQALGLVGE